MKIMKMSFALQMFFSHPSHPLCISSACSPFQMYSLRYLCIQEMLSWHAELLLHHQ